MWEKNAGSSLDLVAGVFSLGFGGLGLFFVELHELSQIELWFLQKLDLSNHAVVLEWVDLAALSLDLFSNFFFKAVALINN
jgi:hypothetical protein